MRDGPERLRRARALVAHWLDGSFVLQNYLTGKQVRVHPAVLSLLDGDERDLGARIRALPDGDKLLRRLVEADVLLVEGDAAEAEDRLLDASWRWGLPARLAHFATRHVAFQDLETEARDLVERARREPPPSPYREHEGRVVRLPDVELPPMALAEALRGRRTRRAFRPEPLPLADFARVVRATWGATAHLRDEATGASYVLKTSPSGGARHPIEAYPVVLRVEGVDPGVYHYAVRRDALVRLQAGSFADEVVAWCGDQPWVRDAAAVVFMAGVVARSAWKYRHAHAYRVLLMDAGHLGQTFHLACTALGLAPFTTAALRETDLARGLGLDGITEIPLYAAAFGRA